MKKILKPKKCRECPTVFVPWNSTQIVCSHSCAAKHAKYKRWEAFNRAVNKERKEGRLKLKTLGQYETEARKVFQLWIRKVRDKDNGCISCGTFKTPQFDAGHYFSANQFSGLMFNEDNVHKQCSQCNDYYSGNLLEYRAGLINRYGLEFVERLEKTKDNGRNYKYNKQELIDIKNKYKALLK